MSNNEKRPPQNLNLPHRDTVTAQQLGNILSVLGTLMPYLINPWRERENIPGAIGSGEAQVAAETTFIKACGVLDNMLGEQDRWSTVFQKNLETKFEEAHNLNMDFLRAQAEAAHELTTPHFRFRPTLAKGQNGLWVAFLGDINVEGGAIIGLGSTPANAIKAFDELFESGRLTPEMMQWCIRHEAAMDNGEESPSFPKQEKTNEQTLDKRRNRKTKKSKGTGQNPS